MFSRLSVNRLQAVLWIVLLAWFVPMAPGQSTSGSIVGAVTDSSGAAVPQATVTVINEGTNISQHVTTGADGVYHSPDLVPGVYTVQVGAKGFELLERKGIVLDANRVVNVDAQLTVGTPTTKVEVQAVAPLVNTETGATSYVKTSEAMLDTPLLVRQSHGNLAWAPYNPGVQVGGSAEIMANGIRSMDGYSSTDGIIEMADPDAVGGGQISPDLDDIAEINYVLVDAPAEYKTPANFMIVSKSGTNRYHGEGFYEYNSNKLNSNNEFATFVPYHVYNDFVVNFGGPIKKDKTFFFSNYDQEFTRGQTLVTDNTALPPWYTGNFTALSAAVVNPFTKQPFTTPNQIPANLITSQGAGVLIVLYPMPNYGAAGLQSGNWRGANPSRGFTKTLDGRIDHIFTARDAFFTHYLYRHILSATATAYMPPLGTGFQQRDSTTMALSWTHTFSPTMVNQVLLGAARNSNRFHPNIVGSNILSEIGIPGVPTSGIHGVPYFVVSGGGVALSNTEQASNGLDVQTNFVYSDNLSWIRGAHSLKFGAEIVRDRIAVLTEGGIYGTYTFNGSYSGNAVADLLMGLPSTLALNDQPPETSDLGTTWSFYAQDNWKVTHRLTVNPGIRYELDGPYYDRFGRIYSFNPANAQLVLPDNGLASVNPGYPNTIPLESESAAGYPGNSLLHYPKLNFYPRLGLAYKLTSDGKTAIRAAYGMYGNTIYGALAQNIAGGPFSASETLTNSSNSKATVATPYAPAFTLADPFTSGSTGIFGALQSVTGYNPNIKTPYLQQWNATLERQIGTIGVTAAYIGGHGTNLLYGRNINQPEPSTTPYGTGTQVFNYNSFDGGKLGTITYLTNGATQHYNALELTAQKRLGSGLSFLAGFTWAKDLTNQEDMGEPSGQSIQNEYCLQCEYGNDLYTPSKRFIMEGVYALPFGHNKKFFNGVDKYTNAVIGGWKVSTVITLQTGLYFTPSFTGPDTSNAVPGGGGRPDVVPGVKAAAGSGSKSVWLGQTSSTGWFNTQAFEIPGCPTTNTTCTPSTSAEIGRFGNAAINDLPGPPLKNADLAFMKDFHTPGFTPEGLVWQLEVQAVNAFNHAALAAPTGSINSGTGSIITSASNVDLSSSSPQRNVYVMIKVQF